MKKIVLFISFLLLISIFGQEAEVTYVAGWVDIKSSNGELFEALIGDQVNKNDNIITGSDGQATLEKDDTTRIQISPNTVFSVREIDNKGKKQSLLHCAVGSVSFKFNKLIGNEPGISTPSMVAGIRGTELTIFTSEEGSSLVAVTSGKVEIEAAGATVALAKDEGVEIAPGEQPGEKFSLKGRELDFSNWNNDKYDEFLKDPISGLVKLENQLNIFINKIKETSKNEKDNFKIYEAKKDELIKVRDAKGTEEAQKFYTKEILPLEINSSTLYLNRRYWALSAFSLKRHILGNLYMTMKGHYISDSNNKTYTNFLNKYNSILKNFEKEVVPFLVSKDI